MNFFLPWLLWSRLGCSAVVYSDSQQAPSRSQIVSPYTSFLKFWFHNFLSSIFFGIILISIKKNTKMILITMIMTCKRINYWKKKILRVSQFLWNYKMLINTFWWFSTVKIYQTRVMIVFMNVWFTSPINQFTLL